MKIKTSVSISEDVLRKIDELAGETRNRSAVIERAVRMLVEIQSRQRRDSRDRELLDQHATRLNREAEDVLGYQVEV